ncbi:MAG: TrbG/VirB9 family P-type conjugative transfer protein [Bryobacteraceae bacterium]
MKLVRFIFVCNLLIGLLEARAAGQVRRTSEPVRNVSEPLSETTTSKQVAYGEKDVIAIKTKIRYSTLIILPKNERILDFTCGDKDFWIINGNQNFALVKPAKPGARTNLNLVTASGNVYSFLLSEVSELPKAEPDLKVFVTLQDETMLSASNAAPTFVSTDELQDLKRQLTAARGETQQVKQSQEDAIDKKVNQFVTNVRFAYHFEAGKKPFYVRAMYHDERFTYIQARPEETPTLYEIRDGKPKLVYFHYRNGLYVIEKILDRGYLVIGKKKLGFTREE